MKSSKVLLVIQAALMYLVQLPLLIAIIFVYVNSEALNASVPVLILSSLIGNLVLLPICFVSLGLSIAGIFKGEVSTIKAVMTVKLALIPWYLINFFFGVLLVCAALNPFLLWAIPLVVFIMCCTTYMYMISTSLPAYSYSIRKFTRREWKPSGLIITALVFMAIFGLDIIGGILLYRKEQTSIGE